MNAPVDESRRALDLQVAAVLRASGGWNEGARRRLAALAQARRVPAAELAASVSRVAAAWGGAGPEHALRAEVPGEERSADDGPASADVAPRDPSAAGRVIVRASVASAFLLVAASALSAAMIWYAVERSVAPTGPGVREAAGTMDPSREPGTADGRTPGPAGRGAATAPAARPALRPSDVPPVPAVYARPPSLRVDASPTWSRAAIETLAGDEPALAAARASLAAGVPVADAERSLVTRVFDSLRGAWPLLQADRRTQALRDACSLARSDGALLDRVRTDLVRERDAAGTTSGGTLWSCSGAVGLLAALGAPADEDEAFAPAARAWLVARTGSIADDVMSGDAARASGTVEAWLAAIEATEAGAGADADAPVLGVIDALLRRDAPMARPGLVADAAGTLLDSLGWNGRAARRGSIAEAFRGWFEDPDVPAAALHGLTSVLASRRPGSWWDPWLVCPPRATAADRARAAGRWATALAGDDTDDPSAGMRVRGVPPAAVERWAAVARAIDGRASGQDPAERLVRAAERIALVEAARSLERGRISDAEARLSQVEDPDGLGLDDLDRWKGRTRRDPVRLPSADGRLGQELRSRAGHEDHVAFLRSIRARAIGDLGPLDAAELAHEALLTASPQVRQVAQGVVADTFAQGPNVISAMAAAVPDAIDPSEAAAVAALTCGQPAPRGSPEQLRAAAILLFLDLHATLVPSDRHRIDAVSTEFTHSANAGVRASGGQPAGANAAPEAAFRAWFDARVAEARPIVPAAALATVVARAQARRSLASPGPQAFVAEQAALLDVDAAILVERAPRLRQAVAAVVQRATAGRAAATDVFAQVEVTAQGLQELAALALAPGEARR
jgi:hypothetical protein